MLNSPFLSFLLLALYRHKSRHISMIFIASELVALLSSVLFIAASIAYETKLTLKQQPDFIVQRVRGGSRIDMPLHWQETIAQIPGTADVTPRVYGRYFFQANQENFLLYGLDLFDAQSLKSVEDIVQKTDIKTLLEKKQMIVSTAIDYFFKTHYYDGFYRFKTPNGAQISVSIYDTFDPETSHLSHDMILMDIDLLRSIFGMDDETITDLAFNVPNRAEWDNIITKLHLRYYDIRVITKKDIAKAYENLYNLKGGLFLLLYLITLGTFMLILYQRYNMVYSSERKEIGILRAVGWSIKDVLKLKFFEAVLIALLAFFNGIIAAYVYVYIFNAPGLSALFLGTMDFPTYRSFMPVIDFGLLGSIFLFFIIPFMASVLIPVWKIAVTQPKEAMR